MVQLRYNPPLLLDIGSAIGDRSGRFFAPAGADLLVVASYQGLRTEAVPFDGDLDDDLTLRLPASAALTGAIDARADAPITLMGDVNGQPVYREIALSADNHFALEHLPEGRGALSLFVGDDRAWSGEVTLSSSATLDLGAL